MVTLRRPPIVSEPALRLEPYQVVLRPIITEKATHQANPPERYEKDDEGKIKTRPPAYTFEVNPKATKDQIKHAIETLFQVEVDDVRTQNRRGKLRRYRAKAGRTRGSKKAIVTLKGDFRIDFF
jgi:large subunit ribosomal protein L23